MRAAMLAGAGLAALAQIAVQPAAAQPVPAFVDGPSVAEVAAAYPPRAKEKGVGGDAVVSCTVGYEGRLRDCAAIHEAPDGLGFGSAARKVAERLRTEAPHGSELQVKVAFRPQMLGPGPLLVPDPLWAQLPAAADFQASFPNTQNGVNHVRVVLACDVAPGGALLGCTVESEDPAGQGYGAGALALAPKFRAGPWSASGLPTVGARVRLPIRYELQQVAPSAK